MPFSDDLLKQAADLARKERTRPRQASLRRAVSTAYYAVFHLLIHDAVRHWTPSRQRDILAREFEHGAMRKAIERTRASLIPDLKIVGVAFVELQQSRHLADYDNSKTWTRTQVLTEISKARTAIRVWRMVRTTPAAEDFLLSLLCRRT
jgi:uncharacterized protein (UPF0332 family)